jgi:hypothetical protein
MLPRGQRDRSYGRILDFLDRSRYFFFQVAPHLYSRNWVDPVPDPLLLRKSSIAGGRALICSQRLWPLDHRGGHWGACILISFHFDRFLKSGNLSMSKIPYLIIYLRTVKEHPTINLFHGPDIICRWIELSVLACLKLMITDGITTFLLGKSFAIHCR